MDKNNMHTRQTSTPTSQDDLLKQKMQEIFKDSIEVITHENNIANNNNLSVWKRIKTSFIQVKNTLQFNSFNFSSNIEFNKDKPDVHFFAHKYNITNEFDIDKFNEKISSLIFISYRNNFPKIKVKDSKGEQLTSDCGWGCIIRACQMLFARALYKLFKKKFNSKTESILNHALFYFLEYPFNFTEMPNTFSSIISKYLSILYSDPNNDSNIIYEIKSVSSPFAIQNICSVGTLFNKLPGKYYSDIHIPHIFNEINKEFNAITNLAILPFQIVIDKSKVIEDCFTPIDTEHPSDLIFIDSNHANHDQNSIMFNNKKYYFTKAGLIFISVRLGIKLISPEYFHSIKKMFECKELMGVVGGKGVYAYYFFGHNNDHLLYLDPHFNQEAVSRVSIDSFSSYHPKKIFYIKFTELNPALMFGFLFKNINEYNDLFNFIDHQFKNNDYACFTAADSVDAESYPIDEIMETEENDF